jgi:hypothetical protein
LGLGLALGLGLGLALGLGLGLGLGSGLEAIGDLHAVVRALTPPLYPRVALLPPGQG